MNKRGLALILLCIAHASATAVPTVVGNTISWPDDDWYQVQNSDNYMSVCEGGSSCEVSPGNYIVINHTTGERFPEIVVGLTPVVPTIVVTDNTISWPDDGWYQVQNADTYDSVCGGGLSCDVPPGIYTVINHTTGERFENISVTSVNNSFFTPFKVAALLPEIFNVVNAVELQNLYNNLAFRGLIGAGNDREIEGFTFTHREYDQITYSDVYFYGCDAGGSAKVVAGPAVQNPTYDITLNRCVVNNSMYDGPYYYVFNSTGALAEFKPGFTIGSDDVVQAAVGSHFRNNGYVFPYGSIGWRISSFTSNQGDELKLSDFNSVANYDGRRIDSQGFVYKDFTVRTDIWADWTDGDKLELRTVNAFTEYGDNFTYQFGSFTVTAEDGTSLTVNANNGDPATFQVDISSQGSNDSRTMSWGADYRLPCRGVSTAPGQQMDENGCRIAL